jgi:aarF domain-containing kinase
VTHTPGHAGGTANTLSGLVAVSVAAVALIMASVPSQDCFEPAATSNFADPKWLPTTYDPQDLKKYFQTRPVKVLQRQAEVASRLSSFLVAILADWRAGTLQTNASKRATWLRTILEDLGPAYVKIGQAMSTRVDLLSDEYLRELQKLQDNVPPFPTQDALEMLEHDLGMRLSTIFEEFPDSPTASASLGQVYRAKLTEEYGGGYVAVKVQRPGVMERIALDTLLMRRATELIATIPTFSDTWSDVLDDWAGRFFQVRAAVIHTTKETVSL